MTRCSPGDLALVIRGFPAHFGKTVTCLEALAGAITIQTSVGPRWIGEHSLPYWRIDRALPYPDVNGDGGQVFIPYVRDDYLMPIRPGDDDTNATPEGVNFGMVA